MEGNTCEKCGHKVLHKLYENLKGEKVCYRCISNDRQDSNVRLALDIKEFKEKGLLK